MPDSEETQIGQLRQESEPKPTSAAEWNKGRTYGGEGFVIELPSGNFARVRRSLDLPSLLRSGKIPNPLGDAIGEMMVQGKEGLPDTEFDRTMLLQLMDLLDQTACSMMVEPRVSMPSVRLNEESDEAYFKRIEEWEPEEGTISIFDLALEDKLFLFYVGQGAAADLERFREESQTFLGGVPAGEDVGAEAESTPGD